MSCSSSCASAAGKYVEQPPKPPKPHNTNHNVGDTVYLRLLSHVTEPPHQREGDLARKKEERGKQSSVLYTL